MWTQTVLQVLVRADANTGMLCLPDPNAMVVKRLSHKKKIRLEDLAKEAGVSVSTVSLALRGDTTITQETRERILTLRDQLGYVPLRAAKPSLRSARPRILFALLHRSFEADPYNVILDGVLQASRQVGFELMMSNELMQEITDKSRALSGVVLAGDIDERVVSLCQERNIPVVVAGSHFLRYPCNAVQVDVFEYAQLSVERAIAEGARRFFYVCSKDAVSLAKRYLLCLRVTLESHGYDLPQMNVYAGDYGSEAFARQISQHINSGDGTDAIFTEHMEPADFCQTIFLQNERKPLIYSLSASDSREGRRSYACLNMGLSRLGRIAVLRLSDLLEGRARDPLDCYACVIPTVGWQDKLPGK